MASRFGGIPLEQAPAAPTGSRFGGVAVVAPAVPSARGSGARELGARQEAKFEELRQRNPDFAQQIEETGGLESVLLGLGRGFEAIGISAQQLLADFAAGGAGNEIKRMETLLDAGVFTGEKEEEMRSLLELFQIRRLELEEEAGGLAAREREARELFAPVKEFTSGATLGEVAANVIPAVAGGVLAGSGRALIPLLAAESQALPAIGETPEERTKERAINLGITGAVGAAGAGIVKGVQRIRAGRATPEQKLLQEAAEESRVPLLTTDILPPESSVGQLAQRLGEKVPIVGTGGQRLAQQKARQDVVQGIADRYGLDINSPVGEAMITSLKANNAKALASAAAQRNGAIESLDRFGGVKAPRAIAAVDAALAAQKELGTRAKKEIVTSLTNIKTELSKSPGFGLSARIRSDLINDIRQVNRGDDIARQGPILQSVKSAMDKDLVAFARTNDRRAAADWLRSNRAFTEELEKTGRTELKRILSTGDSTPENVAALLRTSKPSVLKRLRSSLGSDGRAAARASIMRDALEESGFFSARIGPNPNTFSTALNKPHRIKAIDVFFSGKDKKQLDGIRRLLAATQRAQAFTPETGLQLLAPAAVGGLGSAAFLQAPGAITALATISTAGALARAYESRAVRSLLIRLSNAPKGSKVERELINKLVPAMTAAAQEQQERIGL